MLCSLNSKRRSFKLFIVQVDVYDYMTLVGCLEDLAQAFVIKRVGWLAAWNPCRPEGYMELSLDIREERQVAKVGLVGMSCSSVLMRKIGFHLVQQPAYSLSSSECCLVDVFT